MIDQARAGKRSDSGFKKEAWVSVTNDINVKFGVELVKQQVKSRLQKLKGKYTAVSGMLSASGFGWDAERKVVLVHDDVWEDYLKGHPKCVDYRRTPLPYYDNLIELFEGTFATGDHAISSDEPRPTDFITGPYAVDVNVTPPPNESSRDVSSEGSIAAASTRALPASRSQPRAPQQQQHTDPNNKKRSRESGGVMIAEAIKEIAGEMHDRNVRLKVIQPSQKAVKILQKAYGERFVATKMAEAFDVMLDERKAKLFVAMEAGEVRDIWLDNQLQARE